VDQEGQESIEQLKNQLDKQRQEIQWLQSELMRYKMLLEGKDVMMNSLPTTRPDA